MDAANFNIVLYYNNFNIIFKYNFMTFNSKLTYVCVCKGKKTLMAYQGADKSLARPGRKQATVTEDFDFLISYL